VISADFQCGAKAVLTILLMPSLASIDIVARTGEVSCERGNATDLCLLGRGCRSSVMGEVTRSWLDSGGDRFGE
jgi:hypothetical protein